MKTGAELIAEIDAVTVPRGELAVWWLGQHSFIVKGGDAVVYLDPFLSPLPGRTVPPLLAPADIRHATVVCGSHDHTDHIDRAVWPVLADASPQAKFVVPDLLLPKLAADLAIAEDRFVGLDDGKSARIGAVRVSAIPAAHEFLDPDRATGRYPYLGYVVELNNCALYHAGDTCIYDGMRARLQKWTLDIAFLPINGRDAKRLAAGCIGNMTYQEAVDLAGDLRPGVVVPTHYEMFESNAGDPDAFESYVRVKYPGLQTFRCRHGERFRVRKAAPVGG